MKTCHYSAVSDGVDHVMTTFGSETDVVDAAFACRRRGHVGSVHSIRSPDWQALANGFIRGARYARTGNGYVSIPRGVPA